MVRAFLQTPVPGDIAYSPATIAQQVAEGLARKGHEVTFFGPEGSKIDTALETCGLRALATTQEDIDSLVGSHDIFSSYRFSLGDAVLAKTMFERARRGEFDCLVFNHFESALPYCSLYPQVPVIFILHDFIDEKRQEVLMRHASPNQYYISISNSQRRDAPDLPYAETIYNGIDTSFYTFNEEPEQYLLFCGRVTQDKGLREAIQVAQQTRKRLMIAGSLSASDRWYFDEYVRPNLDDKVLFLGMLDKEQLVKYYQKASALLVPIQWQEPFGLIMAEANACGTPVIAFNRGSVPEVVADGKSGYIVNNSAEMILAIEKIDKIKRRDCRKHVEENFTVEKMISRYESTLQDIVKKHSGKAHQLATSKTRFKKQLDALSKQVFGGHQ